MAFRLISLILSLSLFCQQAGIAYASGELNLANYLSSMRNAVVQSDIFQPPRLRYISYDLKSNDFKLLLDKGDSKFSNSPNSQTPKLTPATQELFNYFLIGLALPNDTFWVNLRPDAPENIIDPLLEKTDIGKIFLEADLQLKKDAASLTSPQNPEGKAYWDKLYKKAGELFGSENITIPTITRPWIVPNEVIVRETEDSAYIYKATLKVMLEADYLVGRGGSRTAPTPDQYAFSDPRLKELNEYSSRIIRETIIPRLTREVNSSKRYAKLRQVYYSLVLARWFKQKYSSLGSIRASEHQGPGASANSYLSLIDSGNLANLASPEPYDKQTYFQAYQKSFKDGEYNLKETVASPSGQSIRNYISGGIGMNVGRLPVNKIYVGIGSDKVTGALMSSGSPITNSNLDGVQRELAQIYYSVDQVKIKRHLNSGDEKEKIKAREEILSAAAKIINLVVSNRNTKFLEFIEGAIEIFNLLPDVLTPAAESFQEILDNYKTKGLKQNFSGIPQDLIVELRKFQDDKLKSAWAHQVEKIINNAFELNDADGPQSVLLRTLRNDIYDLHSKYVALQWLRDAQDKLRVGLGHHKKSQVVEAAIQGFVRMEEDILGEINNDKNVKTSGSPLEELRVYDDGSGNIRKLSYVPAVELTLDEREKAAEQLRLWRPKYSQGYHNIIIEELRSASPKSSPKLYLAMDGESVVGYIHKKDLWIDAVAAILPEIEVALTVKLIREMIEEVVKKNEGKITLLHNEPVTYDSSIQDWRKVAEVYKNLDIGKENKGPRLWIEVMGETLGQLQWLDKNAAENIVTRYDKWLPQKRASSHPSKEVENEKRNSQVIDKSSASPLTLEDMREIKERLKGYAKKLSDFYKNLSPVDLTNGIEQVRFSEYYNDYSRDLAGTIHLEELKDAVGMAIGKKSSGNAKEEWQKIMEDIEKIKERIDLSVRGYIKELAELFSDEEGFYKYFPRVEKNRLYDYNQKYGQRSELKNIATAIEAANIAVALYKGNNIDVREKWEIVAAVLGEIDSISGQWLGNKRKVQSSLSALRFSIEEWYGGLPEDTKNKWLSDVRQEMGNIALIGLLNIQKDISKYDPVKSVLIAIDGYAGELGVINSQAALNAFVKERAMVYMLSEIDVYLRRFQSMVGIEELRGIEGLRKEDADKLNEILKAFRDEMMDVAKVSSALIQGGQEPDVFGKTKIDSPGGIDFTGRAMRLKIERVGSFADLRLVLPQVKNVQTLDLDNEFRQIEAIASSGIVPNSRRILELFSACYSLGEFGRRLPQVISALKSSSAIQEKLAIDSDDDFRLCLLLPEIFSDGR